MNLWSILILFLAQILYLFAKSVEKTITIATLIPRDNSRLFSIARVEPAMAIAVEKVRGELALITDRNISIKFADDKCSVADGINEAINFFVQKEVTVFFGPCCDYAAAPVTRQSAAHFWNIAMVTPGATAFDFSRNKKDMFNTMTRVGSSINSLVRGLISLLKEFSWHKVNLVYDPEGQGRVMERYCHIAIDGIHYGLSNQTEIPVSQKYFKFDSTEIFLHSLAEAIGKEYAIVVLCASANSVREILIKAHELNFDNGEYVFLNIDLFSSKNESEKPWYRANDTAERNEKAKKAYEALMTVTLRKPTSKEYRNFSIEVKKRAKQKNVNFTYGEEEVNSFVGAFHDAVILYALALNETLAANKSITDGAEITKRMWNRTFNGITGTVSIDDNGDRNADYSLLDMNPVTHKFEVVANYFGKDKEYKAVPGKQIHWAGGRSSPPPDTPKCGFDGSKCPPEKPFPEYGIVIIVLGSLLVIVLVAAFFIYRHIKLEAELAEMNWRVKWEDIMFGTMENDKKLRRQGSTISLTRTNGEPCSEGRVLIERSDTIDQSWCKCGQCEESDRRRRVCCRQLELFGIFDDGTNCITTTEDFRNVVLNKDVLVAVFIHVMLVRRQRGAAPVDLSPCKFRLMANRQFLCWMHRGQKLKKESRMTIPSCVSRAIHLKFPDEVPDFSSASRGSCTTTTLAELMPLDVQT